MIGENNQSSSHGLPPPASSRSTPPSEGRVIRVAFLQSRLAIGGAERLVQSLVRRMASASIAASVMTCYDPGPVGLELLQEGRRVTSGLAQGRLDPWTGARLHRACRDEQIDVVYVIDSPLPKFWAGVLRRLSPRPRLIIGYHSTGVREGLFQHAVSRALAVTAADRLVALSQTHRAYLARQLNVDPSRLTVIGSGVDVTRFHDREARAEARRRAGLPADGPLVGIVAALRPEKNHELFLRAARAVIGRRPDTRFFIAGDGPERANVERLRRELGLEPHVLMLGSRPDVPDLMRAADVIALSSHAVVETLPLTLLEAAACGTPSVATRVGSVADVIEEGGTGYLVAPGDVTGLSERLLRLVADPVLRAAMGDAARRRAEAEFDEREMIRRYERMFLEVGGLHSKTPARA